MDKKAKHSEDPDFDPLYDVSDDDGEIHRAHLVLQAAKKRKEMKEAERQIAELRDQIAAYDARDSRNQQIGKVWRNVRESHG